MSLSVISTTITVTRTMSK